MFDLLRTIFDRRQHDEAKGSDESNQTIELLSSFEDALHVAEIIKAARDSSLNKTWVQVNKDNWTKLLLILVHKLNNMIRILIKRAI